jgi:hypothetical protein
MKRFKGHLATFLFFPTAFLFTALVSLLINCSAVCWFSYLIGLWSGCLVGLLITNPVPIKIDVLRAQISLPGSRLYLICLMILCVSKCIFDWFYVSVPEHILLLRIVSFVIKGTITGLLYGQVLSFWYRFSIAGRFSSDELSGRFVRFYGLQRVSSAVRVDDCPSSAAV